LRIDAGNENTIFDWSDGQSGQSADFTKTGSYSVTLKNGVNGCPYTHNFSISDVNQPMIDVINQTSNSIEVIANGGVKPYKYYFNGVAQTSNILSNPKQSSYEIQVESATGCLGPPKTVYFIKINNAFSPNGDGINDLWRIDNLDKMDQVSIVIIDRNGKKVFESTTPTKNEWDGKDNGRALPTSSYWYVISWYDPVTQKSEQRQGWILMKNRN
jgi:gliding motility-associated-like protein